MITRAILIAFRFIISVLMLTMGVIVLTLVVLFGDKKDVEVMLIKIIHYQIEVWKLDVEINHKWDKINF